MNLPPVSTLSLDEALAELEGLADASPDPLDILGVLHWREAHGKRYEDLEVRICCLQQQQAHALQPLAPAPLPLLAGPVLAPAPRQTPQARMGSLVAGFLKAVQILGESPRNTRVRSRAYSYRSQIKRLCRIHDLETPALPPVPTLPGASPRAAALQAPPVQFVGPPTAREIADELGPVVPAQPRVVLDPIQAAFYAKVAACPDARHRVVKVRRDPLTPGMIEAVLEDGSVLGGFIGAGWSIGRSDGAPREGIFSLEGPLSGVEFCV